MKKREIVITVAMLLAFVLIPLTIGRGADVQNWMIYILIFAIAGEGWNLISGMAGQISFGHAAYFGIGAYTVAILGNLHSIVPWIGILVGAVIAAAVAWVVNYNLFRLKSPFFAIATLIFCEILRIAFGVWSFAGAGDGIKILYRPVGKLLWLALDVHDRLPFLYVTLTAFVAVFLVCRWLETSRWGYFWKSISESHPVAGSIGINAQKYKGYAIALSAFITAIAGGFYVQFVKYIDSSVFSLDISLIFLLIVILGGSGSVYGPIIGSIIYHSINQLMGFALGGPATGLNLVVFGAILVLVVCHEPRGIVGIYQNVSDRRRAARTQKEARHG